MKRPVILERANGNDYLWKIFLYFPSEKEIEKVLREEKKLFPKKEFFFSFAEVADF